MKAILVIGNCGVGKTYVMQKVIQKVRANDTVKLGLVNMHKNDRVAVLGKYMGDIFDGSDKLSMSVSTDFIRLKKWAKDNEMTLVVLIEGSGEEGRIKRKSTQTKRQIQTIETRVKNIQHHKSFKNSEDCYNYLCKNLI